MRHAIGYATNRDAIIRYLRRGLGRPAVGLVPDLAWAFEPDVFRFTYDPDRARRLLDEAGYRDPDGNGPLPRLRLSLKISTNEETRLQATAIQHDLSRVGIDAGRQVVRVRDLLRRCAEGQLPAVRPAVGRWCDGRSRHAAPRLPLAGSPARGFQSRPLPERARSTACSTWRRRHSRTTTRKRYYGEAQKLIAADAPYIPIWSKTNVIVAQKGLDGLHLNPVGDFSALRDVKRVATPPPSAKIAE